MPTSGNLHPNGYAAYDNWPRLYPILDPVGYHYEYCDDDPPNDTGDGIENDTTTYYDDLYNCETFTIPVGKQVDSIIVYVRASSGISAPTRGYAYVAIKTEGTVYYSTTQFRPSFSGFTTFSWTWTVNPNTGLRWTQTELDDLLIGVKGKAYSPDYPMDVTAIYYVVNYSDIPSGGAVPVMNHHYSQMTRIRRG